MGENKKIESETIDLPPTDQVRSLCAQFDAECREALKAGSAPRLEAYVAQVPEPQRAPFRIELQKIQQQYQHTQANIDGNVLDMTVERAPLIDGVDNAQAGGPGTID